MTLITSNLPILDMSTSTTGCCPVFNPKDWDNKTFEFKNKLFIKGTTANFMYIPLNMSKVMNRMQKQAEQNDAVAKDFILLSQDTSPWHADHYYAVTKEIAGAKMAVLNGQFYAKVYEGPFKNAGQWHKDLIETVKKNGQELKQSFFYYTTCPKCAKVYGKNFVVGLAQIA
jgi:hypothetical protein